MKRIKLVVVGGDVDTKEMEVDLPATIGRGREASISLTHPLVSRQHCEIIASKGRILVRDLESLNGTFVGSERIKEATIDPGDLLTVGTVTFRAVYEKAVSELSDIDDSGDSSGKGTAKLAISMNDTLRVDPAEDPAEDPAAESHTPRSEPSDTRHAAEYDS